MAKGNEPLGGKGFIMAGTADEQNARLESEIQEMKRVFVELERRYSILEVENHAYQNDLVALKRENDELKAKTAALEGNRFANATEGVVNIIDVKDEDEVFELMAENAALKCEKDMAVKEIERLRRELVELESQSLAAYIRRQASENLQTATPVNSQTCHQVNDFMVDTGLSIMVTNVENRKNVKKRLFFKEEKSPTEKIVPPTPCVTNRPAIGIIDLVDSDDELVDCEGLQSVAALKRRRPFNIMSGDSESDNDNIPISKLMKMHLQDGPRYSREGSISIEENLDTAPDPAQRHFKRLRKFSPRVEEYDSAEPEDANSNSRSDDSLGGFIVDDSDDSYMEDDQLEDLNDSSDSMEGSTALEDSSDEDALINVIPSVIRRSKSPWKLKWEFEADMLAAFGKSPELCMEAVCALYRQQTDDEKCTKGSLHINGRGFSKFDAMRGSDIAEFLTEGDPLGGLKKSLQELEKHDPKAPEVCQNLAARYSRQLFEIYTNKEDPFFFADRVSKLG